MDSLKISLLTAQAYGVVYCLKCTGDPIWCHKRFSGSTQDHVLPGCYNRQQEGPWRGAQWCSKVGVGKEQGVSEASNISSMQTDTMHQSQGDHWTVTPWRHTRRTHLPPGEAEAVPVRVIGTWRWPLNATLHRTLFPKCRLELPRPSFLTC